MLQVKDTKLVRKSRSLGTRMSLIMAIIVFVSTISVLLSVLSFYLRQGVSAEEQRLHSLSSVFRAVLSEPVAQNDPGEIREALRALKDIPSIRQASVRDEAGELLAEMGGGSILDRKVIPSGNFSIYDLLTKDTLQFTDHIVKGGVDVGTLRLTADISALTEQFRIYILMAFGAAGLAILIAFAGGTFLIQRSTSQLSNLASELSGIGGQETLHVSIRRETDDEVGVLVDAFNNMMQRIDVRDRALRRHSENLEVTVAERTRELVAARDEAESANAAKSEFLAMMSHEIRTPLNGMMVMAQMLAAAPLTPRHLRFAEIINRSGQNLLTIINDVLDISKIESGRLVLEQSPFSIDAILADVHGLFFETARERGIALTYVVSPEVPEELVGDAARLNQVITNLVNNALKFTEKGGVAISVSATPRGSRCCLHLAVKDTGIGIAADKLGQVFDRFVQADQTITRRFGGTGLGLAISRRLVEAMGGEIQVASREGMGSTFAVTVEMDGLMVKAGKPFKGTVISIDTADRFVSEMISNQFTSLGASVIEAREDGSARGGILLSDNAEKVAKWDGTAMLLEPIIDSGDTVLRNRNRLTLSYPASRHELDMLASAIHNGEFAHFRSGRKSIERSHVEGSFRGLRALAVDDNKVNRDVLCEVLASLGMAVDTATNGEEAITNISANAYDIVFMDCSMPVMDGFAATRIVRERETNSSRRLPIVAITALGAASGQTDWRKAGMDGWIAKPFTIPSVTAAITDLVLKSQVEDVMSPTSAESSLFAGVASVPLLDEQTIAMIGRLGAHDNHKQMQDIYQLFSSRGLEACNRLSELAEPDAETGKQAQEALLQTATLFSSMSKSIGASRLSAWALQIAASAKSGSRPLPDDIKLLTEVFDSSRHQIAARLGFAFTGSQAQIRA